MIYLACPYSSPDSAVREQRFRAACRAVVELLRAGEHVFSPIVHSHPLVEYDLPSTWAFWAGIDSAHLARCDELVVLMLDGWAQSVGVREELRLARELGKPVRFLEVDATGSPTLARVATSSPG